MLRFCYIYSIVSKIRVLTDFDKSPKYKILRKSRLSVQADRRINMPREIDAFRWCFAKDSKKK